MKKHHKLIVFFLLLISILSQTESFAQKVKFSNLHYKMIMKDTLEMQVIDSIIFYAKMEYKSIDDINDEIFDIHWDYAFLSDSITTLNSRLYFKVEEDLLKIRPHNKEYGSLTVNDKTITYKVYVGDLMQKKILYIYFEIEYKLKYHIKYHDKGCFNLGLISDEKLMNLLKTTKSSRFTYQR
jgi:hypothetical protein